MINIRHTGIYVNNILEVTSFYKNVFEMTAVCENQEDSNILLDELFNFEGAKIITTKLITEQGRNNGSGDMIELVKIINGPEIKNAHFRLFDHGASHIAIGVDNLDTISKKIIANGGSMQTKIVNHSNGNKFAFAKDCEGNWIELIERH